MKSLDEIVNKLNSDAKKAMSGVTAYGVVRSMLDNSKMVNYDGEKRIMFDDKADVFIYHKSLSATPEVESERGMTKIYNISANVDMYVYSKKKNTEDIINTILSKYHQVTITNLNTDSAAIFSKEADAEKYNPSHYVFVVSYRAIFKTSDCLKDACHGCKDQSANKVGG